MIDLQVRFYPSWFHHEYKMTFGDRYAKDLEYRIRLDTEQQVLLYTRFGDIGLGNKNPRPDPNLRSALNNIVSVMFGASVCYQDDNDGWIKPASPTLDQACRFEPIDVKKDPYIRELTRQAEVFTGRYGPALLNPGIDGILNCALNICGESFLTWLVEEEETAGSVLKALRETTIRVHEYFGRLSGRPIPMGLGNCSVCMVGPEIYRRSIMPFDLVWAEGARALNLEFGFHLDGKIDPFLPVIADFPYLHRVDMGCDSDLGLARRILGPDKAFRVYLYPHLLAPMTPNRVCDFLAKLLTASGRENKLILQLDISPGMSDSLIRAIVRFVREQ
jgi:hypothetical protein